MCDLRQTIRLMGLLWGVNAFTHKKCLEQLLEHCKPSTNFGLSSSPRLTNVIALLRDPPTFSSKRKYPLRVPEVTREPLRKMAVERFSGSGHGHLRDAQRVTASLGVSRVQLSVPSFSASSPA